MLKLSQHNEVIRIRLANTILGIPLYEVSAYLMDGLLIDTGCPATATEILSFAKKSDIQYITITHHHEDHAGGLITLKSLGLPIVSSPKTKQILSSLPKVQFYRRLVWGNPQSVDIDIVANTIKTRNSCFQIIPTPGHSTDHVCIFELNSGFLFSGDLFIHEHVKYLRSDENAWETIRSLKKMAELQPSVIFCSHFGAIEKGAISLLKKADYWQNIADQAEDLYRKGMDIKAITHHLLGDEGFITFYSLGDFSKQNLIRSLIFDKDG